MSCLIAFGGVVCCQNLIPNPSFENFIDCPSNVGQVSLLPPWQSATVASPDYFNVCSYIPQTDVPSNFAGFQQPHTGDVYTGLVVRVWNNVYREYITAPLAEPLIAGVTYEVSMWVSLADEFCGSTNLGAYVSPQLIISPPLFLGVLDVEPQFTTSIGFMDNDISWILISGCFVAEGGEAWITIGNFFDDIDTPVDPGCNVSQNSYYFIDDVALVSVDDSGILEFDLGDPVISCGPYVIDPGIGNAFFLWQDGSEESTFVATQSGTYAVTVSTACSSGSDSIEVIIPTTQSIDIGPGEITLCTGESYDIMLDPELGNYTWQDGSSDFEYSIVASGNYQVTLDDGCQLHTDEINVLVVDPLMPFSLGADTFLCSLESIIFNFDPALGDFLWQDNSNSSTYTVVEGGMYSLTISNSCNEVSDDIFISELDIPEFDLGSDSESLCTGDILSIELDPDSGEIYWQDGSNASSYEISEPGLYSVFVTNGCGTESDAIEVTYFDYPEFTFGGDQFLCTGDSLILDPGVLMGNFLWQDASSDTLMVVTSSGQYALTVSNACGFVADTLSVIFSSPVDQPDLGPDLNLCPGDQYVLYADIPDVHYLWQDSSTSDSLLIILPGTYALQVYNSCGTFSDTVEVILNDTPPLVDLPSVVIMCQGDSVTLNAGIDGLSYLWNDNSQNQQLQVTAPGTYSVTVSNACGSDADTTLIIDGGPAPAVSLGNDLSICAGESITLSPVFSNVDSWLWQDGSTLPSFIVSAAGVVTVEVNNSCGNAFDTLQVALLPDVPPLDLGPDNTLCTGESFVLSINTPNVSILWPDGSSANDFLVDNPGLVFASISNSCGVSYDTIEVLALPDIPALNLGPDQSLCPGEIITLSPGIAYVIYDWHDGSSSNSYTSTQQETIILTISNDCGSAVDTVQVFESTEGPQVNLGNDVQVCEGETVTILSGISGVNYLWQDGSTNANYSTTQSGVFILTVNNSCGTDADTITVDISGVPPTPALGPDTTLCENISLLLISTADAITIVEWQDGSASPSFNVTSPGTYILAESNRCGDASDTIIVSYLDAPDPFTLGPDTTLCPGETITLNVPSTSFEIMWQDGSNQTSIIADQPITYSLQLSNDCGTVSDDFILSYDTRVPVLDLGPDLLWCQGDVFTLDATQLFIADYLWSTGASSSTIDITSPGVFSVEVSTACAETTAQVNVEPSTDCYVPEVFDELYIPNVFSPNGDGINDVFILSYGQDLDITGMQGSIYDRWGNLVFSSTDIPFAWNGLFNDEPMLPGVYVYAISIYYSQQGALKAKIAHGDVTLVR